MKCAVFGLNSPTSCLWVSFPTVLLNKYIPLILWGQLISDDLFHPGDCRTVHSWKDSSPVGQDKIPGSLWAHSGSVPLPPQVNDLWNVNVLAAHGFPSLCLFLICYTLSSFSLFLSLRNKIAMDSSQALFLLVAEKSMSCMSASMGEVYSRYSDTDGFLYITYASQEMFGAHPGATPPRWATLSPVQQKWTEQSLQWPTAMAEHNRTGRRRHQIWDLSNWA